MSMDLHNAPLRRITMNTENEYKDPTAWFRPDPDVWAPPVHRDPDVFAPPIDRQVFLFATRRVSYVFIDFARFIFHISDGHCSVRTKIEKVIIVRIHKPNHREAENQPKKVAMHHRHSQILHGAIDGQ